MEEALRGIVSEAIVFGLITIVVLLYVRRRSRDFHREDGE